MSHSSSLIKSCTDKLVALQWFRHWVRFSQMHFHVKITRKSNQLVTSVFRKATFSGVFTNFKSFMSVAQFTLYFSSFSICFSYEKFQEEIVLLKDIFKKNGYPQFFIDKCIKKYLSKLFVLKRIVYTVHKKQVRFVLPFLGLLSFEIRFRLQKCLKNYPLFFIKGSMPVQKQDF